MNITYLAIKASVELSVRYINDRFLPDKAIDLIDEASAKVRASQTIKGETANRNNRLKELSERKIKAINDKDFALA